MNSTDNNPSKFSDLWNSLLHIGYLLPLTTPLYLCVEVQRNDLITPNSSGQILVQFGIILVYAAAIDLLVGQGLSIQCRKAKSSLLTRLLGRLVLWPVFPLMLLLFVLILHRVSELPTSDYLSLICSALLLGLTSTIVCFVVAHELIHKPSRADQWLGGLLLCLVCYPSFKIEHRRSHHRWVGTSKDASSAKKGENLYAFLPRAIAANYMCAWRLEFQRLSQASPVRQWLSNEMVYWSIINILFLAIITWCFGAVALLVFIGQSIVAIVFLETINYLQHYGLRRKRLTNGDYQPVDSGHSWNAPHWLSRWSLFNLMSHSDHHQWPFKPFWALRTTADMPRLPLPTGFSLVVAFIPPLWRWLMDPLVDYYTELWDQSRGEQR